MLYKTERTSKITLTKYRILTKKNYIFYKGQYGFNIRLTFLLPEL